MNDKLKSLAIASINGDKEALELFLEEVRLITLKFVKKRLFNQDLIEDSTQEIIIAVYKALKTFDQNQELAPWLFTIIRRRLIDFTRKHNPNKIKEVFQDESFFIDLKASSEMSGFDDFINILDKLPNRSKEVITSLHLEGKSRQETAEELGISEGNVRVIAHRAVKEVYKFFKK